MSSQKNNSGQQQNSKIRSISDYSNKKSVYNNQQQTQKPTYFEFFQFLGNVPSCQKWFSKIKHHIQTKIYTLSDQAITFQEKLTGAHYPSSLPQSEQKQQHQQSHQYYNFDNAQSQFISQPYKSPIQLQTQQGSALKVQNGNRSSSFYETPKTGADNQFRISQQQTTAQTNYPNSFQQNHHSSAAPEQGFLDPATNSKLVQQQQNLTTSINAIDNQGNIQQVTIPLEGSPVRGTFKIKRNVSPPKEVVEKLQQQMSQSPQRIVQVDQKQSTLKNPPSHSQSVSHPLTSSFNQQPVIHLNQVQHSPSGNKHGIENKHNQQFSLQKSPFDYSPAQQRQSLNINERVSYRKSTREMDSPSKSKARQTLNNRSTKDSIHLSKIEGLSKKMDDLNKEYVREEKLALEELVNERQRLEDDLEQKEALLRDYLVEINELKKDADEKQSIQKTLVIVQQDSERRIQELQSQINRIHQEYNEQIDDLYKKNNKEKNQLVENYEDQINDEIKHQKEIQQQIIKDFKTLQIESELQNQDQLKETIHSQSNRISQLQQELSQIKQQAQHVQNVTSENQSLNNQLTNQFKKIAEQDSYIKKIERDMIHHKNIAQENQDQVDEMEKRLKGYNQENQKLCKKLDELLKTNQDLNIQNQTLQSVQPDIEILELQLKKNQEQLLYREEQLREQQGIQSELEVKNSSLQQQLDSWKDKYQCLEKFNLQHNEQVKEEYQKKVEAEVQKGKYQAEAKYQGEIEELRSTVQYYKNDVKNLEMQNQDLLSQKEVFLDQLTENQKQIDELSIKNIESQKIMNENESLHHHFQQIKKSAEQSKEEAIGLQQTVKKQKIQISELENNLQQSRIGSEQTFKDLNLIEEENKNLKKQVQELKENSKQSSFQEQEIVILKETNSNQQQTIEVLSRDLANLNRIKTMYDELIIKYNLLNQDFQNTLGNGSSKDHHIQQLILEKNEYQKAIDLWREQSLRYETQKCEVESDIKGLIQENDRLNEILAAQRNEIETMKLNATHEQYSKIKDLENRLMFYINENDKLNKILLNRNKSGYY